MSDHASELVERFRHLCREFTQAGLARRTGISENNVSRYARGTKMPLELGATLVEKLGVNPAWLLSGAGPPLITDAQTPAAGELLELLQAMNSLARMPVGALAGKGRAKVLRELDDSLRLLEQLRARMIATTKPLATSLLAEYREQVEKRSLTRAEETRNAIEQVLRLCADDELDMQFRAARAAHLRVQDRYEQAADLQREVFLHGLARRRELTPATCLEAQNLAGALWNLGRVHEARAVCRATMAFAYAGETWPEFAMLDATCAMAEIDLGMLTRALQRLEHALPRMAPAHREVAGEGFILRARLLSGTLDPRAALNACRSRGQAVALLRHAAWLEQPELVHEAVTALIGRKPGQIADTEQDIRHYLELDRALKGDLDAATRMEAHAAELAGDKELGPRVRFSTLASLTQIARVCGSSRAAEHVRATQAQLESMQVLLPSIEAMAQHRRNLLSLTDEKAAQRQWFAEMGGRGYGCLLIVK